MPRPFSPLSRLFGKRGLSGRPRRATLAVERLEVREVPSAFPIGPEFRVNSYLLNNQSAPAISMDADGDFVATWQSRDQDGSNYGVYAQRYNSQGIALGGEFRVTTITSGSQSAPTVGMDAEGDFVVVWHSAKESRGTGFGVYAQRYNAAGVAQGPEFRVNSFTTDDQVWPSVAMDADGDFVVAWESFLQDGSGDGIYAQRYSSGGVAQGREFRVNTTPQTVRRPPRWRWTRTAIS